MITVFSIKKQAPYFTTEEVRLKTRIFTLLIFLVLILLPGAPAWAADDAQPREEGVSAAPEGGQTLVVAQAEAGQEMQVTESAEPAETGDGESPEGEEEEKEAKWWGIPFTYEFAHNLQRERPTAINALSIDPSFTIPYGADVNIGIHLGGSISTEYSTDRIGARDVTVNTADFDPIMLGLSRRFVIDEEYTGFSITPSLNQLFPYTSKFAGVENGWMYAVKPGVSLGVSKWGLSLSNSNAFQKNAHKYDYRYVRSEGDGGDEPIPLNSHTYSNATSLSYSVWKVNMGVSFFWQRSWRYHDVLEQANNLMGYGANVGINPWDNLNLVFGITTNGPERRNGGFGTDYTVPFDPKFTSIFFDISYSL